MAGAKTQQKIIDTKQNDVSLASIMFNQKSKYTKKVNNHMPDFKTVRI